MQAFHSGQLLVDCDGGSTKAVQALQVALYSARQHAPAEVLQYASCALRPALLLTVRVAVQKQCRPCSWRSWSSIWR